MSKQKAPNVAPDLAALVVPIESVQPHPRNARQGDVGALTISLNKFGQVRPIVVQASSGNIVAGNHLWRAASQLRWSGIAVVKVDMDDDTAMQYLIADNRTADLGTYDEDVLADILSELANKDLLEGTGYDGDDVDALLARLRTELPEPGDASTEETEPVWGVVIELDSEPEQLDLLTRMASDGYKVRALMS